MKTVIGVIGEKGSGKGTFVHILQALSSKSIDYVKSSGFLAETLNMWDIPLSRDNLQQLAIIMKGKYGDKALSHAIEKRINNSQCDIVAYDSVRWQEDADMVRSFPKSIIVYITAPAERRYKRLLERKEKIGEGEATFEQFMREEQVSTETDIPNIAKQADVRIENVGTKEELEEKVKDFYNSYLTTTN